MCHQPTHILRTWAPDGVLYVVFSDTAELAEVVRGTPCSEWPTLELRPPLPPARAVGGPIPRLRATPFLRTGEDIWVTDYPAGQTCVRTQIDWTGTKRLVYDREGKRIGSLAGGLFRPITCKSPRGETLLRMSAVLRRKGREAFEEGQYLWRLPVFSFPCPTQGFAVLLAVLAEFYGAETAST